MREAVIQSYRQQAEIQERTRSIALSPDASTVALRAYRHFHPAARVHTVRYAGRIVWMTDKQFDVWCYVRSHHRRNRRITLAQVADYVGCSRATVSRFLRKLDLWRFVDYVALRGSKFGGSWVMTVLNRLREADAYLAGARITWSARMKARNILAVNLRAALDAAWGLAHPARPVVRMQQYFRVTGIQMEFGGIA